MRVSGRDTRSRFECLHRMLGCRHEAGIDAGFRSAQQPHPALIVRRFVERVKGLEQQCFSDKRPIGSRAILAIEQTDHKCAQHYGGFGSIRRRVALLRLGTTR